MDSEILTEYATLASFMQMRIITEQEAFARWGRFEDEYLTGLIAKKADEKTLADARKELADSRAKLEADAAKKGRSRWDWAVEDVRAGRLSVDEVLMTLERYQNDEILFRSGSGKPRAEDLQDVRNIYGPLTERLIAAAAEFKAGGSKFVRDDRRARAGATAPKDVRMAKIG